MMNIQKKSLEHTLALIKSVKTYPIYRTADKALDDMKVDKEAKKAIMHAINEATNIEDKKLNDAIKWLETIISDL